MTKNQKTKDWIRIVGDCHSKFAEYIDIISDTQFSIQLGDFGFNYNILSKIDSNKHKILLGNHENYHQIHQHKHFLGDFGVYTIPLIDGEINLFYVRGGYSIDRAWRTEYVDWFPEEQLSHKNAQLVIELYQYTKPKIMISHECPVSIMNIVVKNKNFFQPSYTALLLQSLLNIHQPDVWIFGHHHQDLVIRSDRTTFICLNELSYIDIDSAGNIGNINSFDLTVEE